MTTRALQAGRHGWWFLLAALLLLPAVAWAQGGAADRGLDARLDGRLDPATRATVLALVDSARAVGLPTEPLVDKAFEGASKRAPGPRIVLALRALAAELGAAKQVLGAGAHESEVVAAAGALHLGVRPAELARMRMVRGRQPLTVALGVLSDLVARGVPADTATTAVLALAGARLADDELVAFRRDVERDIALGAPPAAAASVRVGAVARQGAALLLDGAAGAAPRSATPRRP